MKNEIKKYMKVYDQKGLQLGVVDRIINIKLNEKKEEMQFLVKKNLFSRKSPRIAFGSKRILKIEKRKIFLKVDLVDFEYRYAEAALRRKKILAEAKKLAKEEDSNKKPEPKIKESDIIFFQWNELESNKKE